MKKEQRKSASITLHAGGSSLRLRAILKKDGTTITSARFTDADKKAQRGMTNTHADMAAALAHLAGTAQKAEALGWRRKTMGLWGAADSFSTLPPPPKGRKP